MKNFPLPPLWIFPFFGIIFLGFAFFLEMSDFSAVDLIKLFYGIGFLKLGFYALAKIYQHRKSMS